MTKKTKIEEIFSKAKLAFPQQLNLQSISSSKKTLITNHLELLINTQNN